MANGPLGGFMPTPAAPAQPPQVKLDTTADSRSNFNNFLKSMNGAMSLNPPSMAPEMGAMAPNIAPTDNIDIFNQPVAMMQEGGVADFGDFFDEVTSYADDDRSDFSDDNIDTSSPDSDMDYTDVFSSDELQQATDIGRQTGGDDTPSVPNVVFNNQAISDATQFLPEGNQAQKMFKDDMVNTLKDYAKDNDLAGALNQFQIEAADGDKRGLDIVNNIIKASNVNPASYSAAVFNQPAEILSLDDKNITDLAKTPDSLTDSGLRGSLTPGASQDVIDTAKNAIRASAGNNQAIDNIVAQFGSLDPSIGQLASRTKSGIGQIGEIKPGDVEDLSGTPTITRQFQGPIQARTIFDLNTTGDREFRIPDDQSELDQAPFLSNLGFPSSINPRDKVNERTFRTTVGDPSAPDLVKPGTSITTLPDGTVITEGPGFRKSEKITRTDADRGLGTSGLTKDDIKNIQDAADRDLIARSVEDKSRIFEPSINIGGVNIPNFLGRGLNKLAEITDQRVMRGITEKGLIPVRDTDGTITGAKDKFGNLIEGMDFNAPLDTGDSDPTPIIRPLTPKPEEPKPDLPPNVIGGTGGQIGNLQPITADTVVASPFAPASSNIRPVTFDAGQLNRLIEMLTGVPARPVVSAKKGGLIGMANGGLIKAVDDFLAAS